MSTPTVSVILPTYQRRALVQRAVVSVLAQTFRDYELIVVDDGSIDGTREALARFAGRLRYEWQQNRGVAAARNAALRLARGSIVAFLDSDDRWLPDHLETVVAMLESNPDAVLASTCVGYHVGGRQDVRRARVVDAMPSMLSTLGLAGHTSGIAVRREAVLAVGGFDERLPVAEDHHLWLRLAGRGSFVYLQRRTHVRLRTRDSLIEQGIRAGSYARSFELIAAAGLAEADRHSRDAGLAARARAACAYVTALHALARFDDETARGALATACHGLPDLASRPDEVANRLHRIGRTRAERLHHFATAATAWPDEGSDTALFLRARALALALRAGQPRQAVRLVAGWPLRPTSRFIVANLPLWARLARRRLQARRA